MFWVVQENNRVQPNLVSTLERLSIPHIEVRFLPLAYRCLAPIDLGSSIVQETCAQAEIEIPVAEGLVMVCGTISLARLSVERGWYPGSFTNKNFRYSKLKDRYGRHLLNPDSVVGPLDAINPSLLGNSPSIFIRPCDDDKAFKGRVLGVDGFAPWRKARLEESDASGKFPRDLEVAMSSVKEIYTEFRFFVVDGQVVTGSQYRSGDTDCFTEEIPAPIQAFAQSMVDLWQPARAFVIDIAETPEGPKIIEINNLNSSAFYACNAGKLVQAIEAMAF